MQEVRSDPRFAARFCASVPALPAEIDAKGDVVVSICRIRDRAADGPNAVGRAGAINSAGVGEVIWLRSGTSAAGCIEALCDDPLPRE